MAERQYIGARYVIKIYENSTDPSSAEWEQGNYEPLIMVTWMNGSYLSKKQVPATVGNPASNPNYWVQTGFYNGQIANLQSQIDDINNNKLPAVTSAIQDLTNDVDAINKIMGKNIIIISDSYGTNFGTMTDNFLNIMSGLLSSLGYNVTTFATNGASFTRSGYLYESMLDNYTGDASKVDGVYVFGGLNDANYPLLNLADIPLATGIANFITHCNTNFPNATPYFGFVGRGARPTSGNLRLSIISMINSIRSEWIKNHGVVISNCEYILTNQNLIQADGLHPNDEGANALAEQLTNAIIGKGVDVHYIHIENTTDASNNNYQVYETIDNGLYSIVATVTQVANLPASLSQGSTSTLAIGDVLTRDLSRTFGFISEKSRGRIDGVYNDLLQFTIGDNNFIFGAMVDANSPISVNSQIDMIDGKFSCNSLLIG